MAQRTQEEGRTLMAARINIEVDENTLRNIVHRWLCDQVGAELDPKDIKIVTKSKQNYKSEWEEAEFKATVNKTIDWLPPGR